MDLDLNPAAFQYFDGFGLDFIITILQRRIKVARGLYHIHSAGPRGPKFKISLNKRTTVKW